MPGSAGDLTDMASPRDPLNAVNCLAEFRRLQLTRRLTPAVAARLASEAAAAWLQPPTIAGDHRRDAVTCLCELASVDDPTLARIGVHGLFPLLVEPLGDAFTATACALYNQLFAQVIQYCRTRPEGMAIDRQLRHFGLVTEADLLRRATQIRQRWHGETRRVEKMKQVFVLSRVTLGADIAVTSVVLAAMKAVFPRAEIRLVANAKTMQLFAGDPRIQLCAIDYPRSGGLIERLTGWQDAVEVLRQQTLGLDSTEYLIIDPDSRLTQLGLLPLVADELRYLFFESRSYGAPQLQKLSALTAHWLQQVFDITESLYPYCAPAQSDRAAARRIVSALKRLAARPIVSVNLGIGANPAKRLPDPFEFRLLARLLSEGAIVILDKGAEAEEVARVDALASMVRGHGYGVLALDERRDGVSSSAAVGGAAVLTWQGGIGRFAALIAESTAYIGYDSAGQHIAAALGVPTIDIFTGFTSPRMPERWSPHGPGAVHVLVLGAGETYSSARLDAIVEDVLGHIPRG
jgi:ADP-heptose:LPS heptosyltransferase